MGVATYVFYGVAGVLLAGGITAAVMAKSLKAKLVALSLPILAGAWVLTGNPQPVNAATGAPTVTTEAVIQYSGDGITAEYSLLTDPVFDNPENCGTLSYQWQGGNDTSVPMVWSDSGTSTVSPTEFTLPYPPYCFARLTVTLTNSSGSATSTSNELGWCA